MPVGYLLVATLLLQRQGGNPFTPPQAKLQYAPDRTCDLTHLSITLDVDYPKRAFTGRAVNTLTALRTGVSEVLLHADPSLQIFKMTLNGREAKFRREGRDLYVSVPPTKRGQTLVIAIDYRAENSKARPFGGEGGFHWIEPRNGGPETRVGFWTQGETEYNSKWVPTWDYPNDFATYDQTYTVDASWTAIGNGRLESEKLSPDGKRKTFVWKQDKPHATYLLTAVGGPFDIKKDNWQGVSLWYVVPKGQGKYIDDSFGDTPEMLTFFSERLGFKYPFAKYAQNAMYDFGGGMENASATTLGEGSLTEAREGFRNMASLNSHELAHQWFGDTVTAHDWGQIFNNESFATFLEALYFEHSRGRDAYLWEIENNQNAYLSEARRYKRPIITNLYANGDVMFDSHTYPKGGDVLHTLRRHLGDEAFFAGLKHYLDTNKHSPVTYHQLVRSFEAASGINVEPFFDQWFLKPGHPVLSYDWKQDGPNVVVSIKQNQDTADGTPVYRIPNATFGVVKGGSLTKFPFVLDGKEQTVTIPASSADAVVLDPEHDFLRVVSRITPPTEKENIAILKAVADPAQRAAAMDALAASGTPAAVEAIIATARADRSVNPALRGLSSLADLKKPELRAFWIEELDGKNAQRRAGAVRALGQLGADPATTQILRARINDKEYIPVVVAAIQTLASWDKNANKDVFEKATKIEDRRGSIARAARGALE
ncbi:aminopeptidase [bacterium]|nr:MAG: aminopeptidase [bacterium]